MYRFDVGIKRTKIRKNDLSDIFCSKFQTNTLFALHRSNSTYFITYKRTNHKKVDVG